MFKFLAITALVSSGIAIGASPALASALNCRAAFPTNTVEQFQYLHQISGFPDFTSRELGQMNELANQFDIPDAKLYERVQTLKDRADRQMALALNNG